MSMLLLVPPKFFQSIAEDAAANWLRRVLIKQIFIVDSSMVLRNSIGMIMSVLMFWMSRGAAMPDGTVNLGRPAFFPKLAEPPPA